jgi:hypothetical protein
LQTLGVNPERFSRVDHAACPQVVAESPILVEQQVDRNSLLFKVPASDLLNDPHYSSGGNALIVNYDGRRPPGRATAPRR